MFSGRREIQLQCNVKLKFFGWNESTEFDCKTIVKKSRITSNDGYVSICLFPQA